MYEFTSEGDHFDLGALSSFLQGSTFQEKNLLEEQILSLKSSSNWNNDDNSWIINTLQGRLFNSWSICLLSHREVLFRTRTCSEGEQVFVLKSSSFWSRAFLKEGNFFLLRVALVEHGLHLPRKKNYVGVTFLVKMAWVVAVHLLCLFLGKWKYLKARALSA